MHLSGGRIMRTYLQVNSAFHLSSSLRDWLTGENRKPCPHIIHPNLNPIKTTLSEIPSLNKTITGQYTIPVWFLIFVEGQRKIKARLSDYIVVRNETNGMQSKIKEGPCNFVHRLLNFYLMRNNFKPMLCKFKAGRLGTILHCSWNNLHSPGTI